MTTSNYTAKRPDGVTLLAVLHFISGGLGLLAGFILFITGFIPLLMMAGDAPAWVVLVLFFFGAIIVGLFSLLAIFAGVGMLRMRNWARWVTIILAILNLPAFPLGTVVGGLIIWYLLQDNVAALFEKRGDAQTVLPAQAAAQPQAANDPNVPEPPKAE